MFRIVLTKVPSERLTRRCYDNSSRLYKTIRYYSQGKKNDLCPPSKPKSGSGTVYTIGAFVLLGGATLGYAKYDPDFREWLTTTAPFTDDVIKFVFQEDQSFLDSLYTFYANLKGSIIGLMGGKSVDKSKREPILEVPKDYHPPSPAFSSLAKENIPKEENYAEIRIERIEKGISDPIVEIAGELKKDLESVLPDTHPVMIAELEAKIGLAAAAAVQAYNTAVYALKNYNQDIQAVIEDSVERLDPGVWSSLKAKTEAKDEAISQAEKFAANAKTDLHKLKEIMSKPDFAAPDALKQQALYNIEQLTKDIDAARKELEKERNMSNVTEKYWKKVEAARDHFSEELHILFPSVNVKDKKLTLTEGDLDLFILHAFSNVLFYQKELSKVETVNDEKLKSALELSRRGGKDVLSNEQIEQEVDTVKRDLALDFHKRCLSLRNDSEKDLRFQLKTQSVAFSDHLDEALKTRELELERAFNRQLDEKITAERCKFKLQLSAMVGRLRGMDEALKVRAEADKTAHQAQVLWSACQALFRSIKAGCPGLPWTEQLRPLEPEIAAVTKAAAGGDELVNAVIAGIPKEAKERGVFPEDALRERFLKVEKVARSLALVPEGGARLPIYILSYIQSMLLLKAASPIPQAELNDEKVDFRTLNTNEILQRARYWLDRGDFAQTLRYMNLLKGASRCAARQWMEETKILLETQQAANTLMAHAAASGLMYL